MIIHRERRLSLGHVMSQGWKFWPDNIPPNMPLYLSVYNFIAKDIAEDFILLYKPK